MYFIGLNRDESGNLVMSLTLSQTEYTDTELANELQKSINQIGPLLNSQTIYIDKTLETQYAMRLGWILRSSYGCTVYIWNSSTEKYVLMER